MDEATYSAVLDSIYDAALDARLWPRTLEGLADALHSGPSALLFQDQVTMLGTGATVRLDPAALTDYYDYFGARNPLTARNDVSVLGTRLPITLDEQIIAKADFMRTEYYNDFSKPNGMHSALMITTGWHDQSIATVNIMRSPQAPDFDADDIRLAQQFQPHLARAFRLALRLGEAAQGQGALAEVMERSPHGLFLVGAGGAVQHANRAGLAMLGDGLVVSQGELGAATPEASRRLRRLIAEASARWRDERRGGGMTLPRPSLRRPLSVLVSPLGRGAAEIFDLGPAALVCVSDPEATPVPDTAVLAQLFDLSLAEIRVAERLMLGETPRQAAAALGIGVSTARWHLAAIYRKTGTGRQAQLVRLLLSLPASGKGP